MTRPVLHVITDEALQQRYSHQELTEQIVGAGVDFLQYREKRPRDTRTLIATARVLQKTCHSSAKTRFIVNDRADVALAVGSCGVHIGANDLPVSHARAILGSESIIGGTLNNPQDWSLKWAKQFDYLGVGPVFGTHSKANPAPSLGLHVLAELSQACPVDVIAIGNISLHNIDSVLRTGVAGVAVLSAVCCAPDPGEQAAQFMRAVGA